MVDGFLPVPGNAMWPPAATVGATAGGLHGLLKQAGTNSSGARLLGC